MPASSWSAYGATGVRSPASVACSGSTSLTNLYTIGVDVGTANPAGQGLTFTIAASGYTGRHRCSDTLVERASPH